MKEHRLAAIMFTDIVGYTSMMGSNEAGAMRILETNREIHKKTISKFHGKWLKEMGDGQLASFQTASEAVYCAGALITECKKKDITIRIGIHLGEIVEENGDIFGDGVNVASRLEPLAEPGGILVSEPVHRAIKNKDGIESHFEEKRALKNVDGPVSVYKVQCTDTKEGERYIHIQESAKTRKRLPYLIVGGLFTVIVAVLYWFYPPMKSDLVLEKSIAVIPFWNDSPDSTNNYFCQGMEEEIRIQLFKISDLDVESRQSVEQYRENPDKDIGTIGEELKVTYILEGSLRKIENDIRLNIQLIKASTGIHVWADTYDGKYTKKILDFQTNTAMKIARALHAAITPEEEKRIVSLPTETMEAYDLYLRGNHEAGKYWGGWDNEHRVNALELYHSALDIDPEFYRAYLGIGLIHMQRGEYDSALLYTDKVIAIDPTNSKAALLRGEIYFFARKIDLSIENYQKVIDYSSERNNWPQRALARAYSAKKDGEIKALTIFTDVLRESKKPIQETFGGFIFANIGDYQKADILLIKSMENGIGCTGRVFYSWILSAQSRYAEAEYFLDSLCPDNNCEIACDIGRFYIRLLKNELNHTDQKMIPLLETGRMGDKDWVLGKGRWKMFIGDSVLLGYLHKYYNREQEALNVLNIQLRSLQTELEEDQTYVTSLNLSATHALLGEKEEALFYLEKAIENGLQFCWHDVFEIHPVFENLWNDSEFKAIVKRAKDEKAAIRAEVRELEKQGVIDL